MKGIGAFFRLAWRPGVVIGDLLIVFGGCVFFAFLSGGLAAHIEWFARSGADLGARTPAFTLDLLASSLLLLLPAGMGAIGGGMLRGLLVAHASWTLPGVRRSVLAPLCAVGAVASIGGFGLARALGSDVGPLAGLALGWLAFTVGTSLFDYVGAPRAWVPVALGFAAAVFGARELVELASQHALVAAVVAGASSPLPLLLLSSAARHRVRVRIATSELGGDYAPIVPFARAPRPRGRGAERLWRPARIQTLAGWVRATVHESVGRATFGLAAQALVFALAAALAIALVAYQDGFEIEGSPQRGLEYLYHALFHPDAPPAGQANGPPYVMVFLVASAALVAQTLCAGVTLRSGVLYPLTREARARVLFRSAGLHALVATAALALVLGAQAELVRWLGDFERPAHAIPWWARACLLALLGLPLVQYVRHRVLEPRARRLSGLVRGAIGLGLLTAVFLVGWSLQTVWSEAEGYVSLPVLLLVLCAAFAALELALREGLRRFFARCDLV